MQKAASYWEKTEGGTVVCHLCPAECRLTAGKAGICRCRFNQNGELVTNNYGELVTLALDPIEKKPLYHFYPGSQILSTGPNCCNLGCLHCQNWTISQKQAQTTYVDPDRLVATALGYGSLGVAFTYTEPMVWFEYIMEVAPLLRAKGQKVVLVTNGYINPEPFEELLKVTDALNIDLKGITREFYLRICKGKIEPVLATIRRAAASQAHLELTNLIIPNENDSDADLLGIIEFVASLSDRIPIHFSAYHPDYRLDRPQTPTKTLLRARELANRRLKYVYLGNIMTGTGSDTTCPNCGQVVVKREGYHVQITGLDGSRCVHCGSAVDIRR
ncbi:MAG TPA: AmmeMemoRadiSam system radical SAM enzyme [Candidatus Acidoferrum sp.]|nr:AmmeMemoRadiSam system radical SAM enzyme [Candidatus Acidoferrum sp.]